jgi:uncharacterized protein (DUF427 family)
LESSLTASMLAVVLPSERIEPASGQESVWDYPRPPAIDPVDHHVVVKLDGVTIAESRRAVRVLETSQAPAYYLPPDDVRLDLLPEATGRSFCEWKGHATYHHVVVGDQVVDSAAWRYPDPVPAFDAIRDHIAFYPHRVECFVDGERVQPMPGTFYGGWVTSRVVGPFKGGPGTATW